MSRVKGWDERDYKLWSDLQSLPSYALIAPNDHAISLRQVVALMEKHALHRHETAFKFTPPRYDEVFEENMDKLDRMDRS
jgi:hypothetical protein